MRLVWVEDSDLEQSGGVMTTAIFSDGRELTESEFLALKTPDRVELFDGSLHVTPGPSFRHQSISRRLANALDNGAEAAGLQVAEAVTVRTRPNRIPIPDIVVASGEIDLDESVTDAADVRLVCEILSPSNATTDKVLKMEYYATGKIPWYLIVDPKNRTFHLYKLKGDSYTERSVTTDNEVLRLTDPVVATIDPTELLPPG